MKDPRDQAPKVGDYLYASCAGEDYGQVITVGQDGNDFPTIDIEIYDINELISCGENNGGGFPENDLTRLELPPNTKVILRAVQWIQASGWEHWSEDKHWVSCIVCNTPGSNCFRCTKLFSLQKQRTKF